MNKRTLLFLVIVTLSICAYAQPLRSDNSINHAMSSEAHDNKDDNENDFIRIGQEEQLFMDDYLVKRSSNILRKMHPARKFEGNPVLWPNEPWENKTAVLYGSVIRDNDKYKMWYKVGDAMDAGGVGYAESWDGITWMKPLLNKVTINGQKTNILLRKRANFLGPEDFPTFFEIFGVHKDERDPDSANRYKMGFLS